MRAGTCFGALLLCAFSIGCKADGAPESSSGSHWIKCAADSACVPYDPEALCMAGYCVGSDGERLEDEAANLEPEAAPSPGGTAGSEGGAGPSSGAAGGTATASAGGEGGAAAGGTAGIAGASSGGAGATAGAAGATSGPAGGAGGDQTLECPATPPALEVENVFDGDYVITGQSSIDAASGFTEITGSLGLQQRASSDFDDVALPGLLRIGGSIVADQSRLARLLLPRLETIGGDLRLNNDANLVEVDLVRLESVAGSVAIAGNPLLTRLSLPVLNEVGGTVEVGPSQLANCEVQPLFDTVLGGMEYSTGRADCGCAFQCERWIASCP